MSTELSTPTGRPLQLLNGASYASEMLLNRHSECQRPALFDVSKRAWKDFY